MLLSRVKIEACIEVVIGERLGPSQFVRAKLFHFCHVLPSTKVSKQRAVVQADHLTYKPRYALEHVPLPWGPKCCFIAAFLVCGGRNGVTDSRRKAVAGKGLGSYPNSILMRWFQ